MVPQRGVVGNGDGDPEVSGLVGDVGLQGEDPGTHVLACLARDVVETLDPDSDPRGRVQDQLSHKVLGAFVVKGHVDLELVAGVHLGGGGEPCAVIAYSANLHGGAADLYIPDFQGLPHGGHDLTTHRPRQNGSRGGARSNHHKDQRDQPFGPA